MTTDPASGIVNDPNDWTDEHGDPRYILDLLAGIVTVSVETVRIVDPSRRWSWWTDGLVGNIAASVAAVGKVVAAFTAIAIAGHLRKRERHQAFADVHTALTTGEVAVARHISGQIHLLPYEDQDRQAAGDTRLLPVDVGRRAVVERPCRAGGHVERG